MGIKQKSLSIGQILKSPIQILFFAVGSISLLMIGPFVNSCFNFVQKAKANKPSDYVFPEVYDLKYLLMSAIVWGIIEYSTKKYLPFIFYGICKEQEDLTKRHVRCVKAVDYLWRGAFFTGSTMWGYHVMKDGHYLPASLGGRGDYSMALRDFPYQQHSPQLKEYILVTMGYHLSSLVIHFLECRRSDYIEMGMHHIMTIFLFVGMYLFNIWEIGAVIAFQHDIVDIVGSLTKVSAETKYSNFTAAVFVTCIIIWTYTRVILLPVFIYQIAFNEVDFGMGEVVIKPFFLYMLCCLFILHVYWLNLFLQIIYRFVATGDDEDVQTEAAFEEDDKKDDKVKVQ